jgi:3-methyladenine DNA glycosylase AlkD
MSTAHDVRLALAAYTDPERAPHTASFFKSDPGGYAEGDLFLGITVPNIRKVAKAFSDLPLPELAKILHSKWHEERELALIILVTQYAKADATKREVFYAFYLSQTTFINNWDLVDVSTRDIVGRHIYDHPSLQPDLDRLAASPDLWERRIAMVTTFYFLANRDAKPTIRIATILLHDNHDLIQKAVGWMLREMGKRVDRQLLVDFLAEHYRVMPRTALRYAIEHFDAPTRQKYLSGDI